MLHFSFFYLSLIQVSILIFLAKHFMIRLVKVLVTCSIHYGKNNEHAAATRLHYICLVKIKYNRHRI